MRYRYPVFVGAGVAASVLAALLGYAQKLPCSSGGAWNSFTGQFRDACYTDIYPLYYTEGLSAGKVPYYGHPVEYPVLMGWMMQAAAWAVHTVADASARGKDFYDVSVVLLAVCLLAGVLATAATAHREGEREGWKAALLVALSPGLILAAFINWDLLAMALTACGVAAWAAYRPWLAGVLLGLGVASKFYPLLVFGALFLLCLRAGTLREFWKALAGGLAAWLVINLPVAFTATSGWAEFYAFSRSRGADWGSVWFLFEHYNLPVIGDPDARHAEPRLVGRLRDRRPGDRLARPGRAAQAPAAAALLPAAGRVPDAEQGVVAAVRRSGWCRSRCSPGRGSGPTCCGRSPRSLTSSASGATSSSCTSTPTDVGYTGISTGWYFVILAARLLSVALLAGTVVRDIWQPERDRVRASGRRDDPAGGPLDGAPDRLVLGWRRAGRPGGRGRCGLAAGGAGGRRLAEPLAEPGDVVGAGPTRGSRRPPGRPPRGPRRAAPAGRWCPRGSWRAGPRPSRTRRASCCSAPGRSGR